MTVHTFLQGLPDILEDMGFDVIVADGYELGQGDYLTSVLSSVYGQTHEPHRRIRRLLVACTEHSEGLVSPNQMGRDTSSLASVGVRATGRSHTRGSASRSSLPKPEVLQSRTSRSRNEVREPMAWQTYWLRPQPSQDSLSTRTRVPNQGCAWREAQLSSLSQRIHAWIQQDLCSTEQEKA